MTKDTLRAEIVARVEKYTELKYFIEAFDFTELEKLNVEMNVKVSDTRMLIKVTKDYTALTKVLSNLHKQLGAGELRYEMNWSDGADMMWSWESQFIEVWFRTPISYIPEELLGSDGCQIQEEIKQESIYRIVCPVKS